MLMQDAYMNVTPQQGMGSGIIIDPKGLILTNNHIAENAQSMMVSMFDGTKLEGKVVGTDPMSDVAVQPLFRPGLYISVAEDDFRPQSLETF
jgi:S1-C subfamily serine protease